MKFRQRNPFSAAALRASFASFIVLSALPLAAQTISINFGGAANAVNEASKLTGPVPVAGNFWNNPVGPSGTGAALIDSTGNAAGAVTWNSANIWSSASTGATATSENGDLYKDYLDDGAGGPVITVKTPYLLNDVYVIPASDVSPPNVEISAMAVNGVYYKGNGAGGTIRATGSNDSWIMPAGWTAADTLVESANFLKIPNQLAVSVSARTDSPGRGPIAGLQIKNAYTGTLQYWDANGAAAGAGGTFDGALDGTWGADAFWSSSASGETAASAWTPGAAAVFSAGSGLDGFNTVTISGTQKADAVWVQEGRITLTGGTLDLTGGSGLLRGDDFGLVVDSILKAGDFTTAGIVQLGNAGNLVTGKATLNGLTYLDANQTFPQLEGSAQIFLGGSTLTVGSAVDSTFNGSIAETGTLNKAGSGTLTLGNSSAAFGGNAVVSGGTLKIAAAGTMGWGVTGAGNFAKSADGQLTVLGAIANSGSITIDTGILQLGDLTDTGSLPANAPIVINSGMLRYRHNAMNDSIAGPVSLGLNGELRQHSATTGKLTISGSIVSLASDANGNAAGGIVGSAGGELVFASGSNSVFRQLQLANGTATVEAGSSLRIRYLNVGNGPGAAGTVTQTGGTVTMEPGDNGVRIGHWSGAGRAYTINGGTFDASSLGANTGDARYLAAGWDGEGDLIIGGGAGTATVKAAGVMFDRDRAGTGGSASTATLLPKGVLEIGALGILGQGTDDGLVLSGGTARGVETSTWKTPVAVTTATSSAVEVAAAKTVTQNQPLTGDGTLAKTGDGTLFVNNAATTFSGAFNVNAGALRVSGELPAAVTVASGASIGAGPAEARIDSLSLAGGSFSDFALGGATAGSIWVNSDLTVTGTHTIRIKPAGILSAGQKFEIVSYPAAIGGSGFAGLALAPLANPHYALSLVDDFQSLAVRVDSVADNVWTGTAGSVWNLTTSNWNAGGASKFYDGDVVVFPDLDPAESVVVDTLGGTAPISPAGMKFTNTTATTYTISGDAISGAGGLVKTGDGTVILTNDNTFTGLTDIQAGVLQLGNGGATGSVAGNIAIASGALLDFRRSGDFTAGGAGRLISGTGRMEFNGAGTMTLAGQNSFSGGLTVNSGTVRLTGGGWYVNPSQGTGMLTINPGATVVNVNAHAFGGSFSPEVDMTINGGTFQVQEGTYIRDIRMTGGKIENFPGATSQIQTRGGGGTDIVVEDSATQSVISTIYFTGEGASTITVNDPDTDFLISGAITGDEAITKNGVGTLVSSGANTHSGEISINQGTVKFTGDNSARTGGTSVNGTNLTVSSVSAASIGTGFLALNNGTLTYTGAGAETTTRLLWIDRGTGTFDITKSTAVLTLNPTGGLVDENLTKNGPGRLRMQGAITGGASVTVNGGRLDLDGANAYTGETTVNAGGLAVMSLPNLDDTSTIRLNGSGKLNLDHGFADTVGALVIDGVVQAGGKSYGGTGSGATVIDGHFTGSGTLFVAGAATGYDDWMANYPSISGADREPGADPDNDGMTNQQEYAFGLDPSSGSSANPILAGLNKTAGTFTYQRRKGTGLSYKVLVSTNLADWTVDSTAVESPVVDAGDNENVTVTLSSAPAAPAFFVRVAAQ